MFDKILVVSGPTASGKSKLAEKIYSVIPSTIINADALQVYDALPILTAKPCDFQKHEKYKLYSALPPEQECSVAKWLGLAENEIMQAWSKQKLPVVIGGTGFYIKSLLYGLSEVPLVSDDVMGFVKQRFDKLGRERFFALLCQADPMVAKKLHANDIYRVLRAAAVLEQAGRSIYSYLENDVLKYKNCLHIFLDPDRANLYRWCNDRFEKMLEEGVVDEVQSFLESKNPGGSYAVEKAIGYKQIEMYLNGNISLSMVTEEVQRFTRNYAKRQYTWFRNQIQYKESFLYNSYADIENRVLEMVMRFYSELS